jgi:hypothetical protein
VRSFGLLAAWLLLLGLAGLAVATPARAAERCGWSGYSYAGVVSAERAHGIAATLSALRPPRVEHGHTAAWVGVGGYGAGPGGSDEWLQAGLVDFPGSGTRLYYEVKRPGRPRRFVEAGWTVVLGSTHRVAVVELSSRPGWWRVWLDGRPAGGAVFLPRSHGLFRPMATAESWDGGERACNRFTYRFAGVAIAAGPHGAWRPLAETYRLEDPGYRVLGARGATFVATAG